MQLELHIVVVELVDGTFNAYVNAPWRALQHAMCRKGSTAEEAIKYMRASIEEEASMNGIASIRDMRWVGEMTRTRKEQEKDALSHDAAPIGGQTPWSTGANETELLMRRCVALSNALAPLAAVAYAYDKNGLDEARPEWVEDNTHPYNPNVPLYCGRGGAVLISLQDALRARATYHHGRQFSRDGELSSKKFRSALLSIQSCLTTADPSEAIASISQIIKGLEDL